MEARREPVAGRVVVRLEELDERAVRIVAGAQRAQHQRPATDPQRVGSGSLCRHRPDNLPRVRDAQTVAGLDVADSRHWPGHVGRGDTIRYRRWKPERDVDDRLALGDVVELIARLDLRETCHMRRKGRPALGQNGHAVEHQHIVDEAREHHRLGHAICVADDCAGAAAPHDHMASGEPGHRRVDVR